MFFLVYGEDTYRSKKKLAALRERFSATRDSSGLNTVHLREADVRSGKEGAELDPVAEALFASPFLAERKLVILDGFLSLAERDQERLADMLGRKPESTVVIFHEAAGAEALSKASLYPLLAKQKFSEECKPLVGAQLERALIDEAAAAGVKLSPRAARAIVETVGADSWQVHAELDKVCAFARASGKNEIVDDMLRMLVPGARERSLFAFLDACTDGRCAEAAIMLEELIGGGTSELQIIAMLEKHYRTLIAVADLVERGARDKDTIARTLGIHPFPASKAIVAVRKHRPTALRRRHGELLDIERAAKTGTKPKVLLSLFVATA